MDIFDQAQETGNGSHAKPPSSAPVLHSTGKGRSGSTVRPAAVNAASPFPRNVWKPCPGVGLCRACQEEREREGF